MNIKIDDLLNTKGRTRYWLAKEINVTYPTIMRICNNESTSINLNMIENICNALECTPNDIFELDSL